MGAEERGGERENRSSDSEKDDKHENSESDYEPARESLSPPSNEDNDVKEKPRIPKKITSRVSVENNTRTARGSSNRQASTKLQAKISNNSQRRAQKSSRASSTLKALSNKKSDNRRIPSKSPSELSEESDDKTIDGVKNIDVLDEAFVRNRSAGKEDEIDDKELNNAEDSRTIACQKIEEMEQKIKKLEQELREVAALEISLYSVVPEHGSSAHKVHTPARRLSRLYVHACKHWTEDKRATVAENTVSGLVLIAKSCGNDVSRLMFWLSNIIVLREIISQTLGYLSHPNSAVSSGGSNGNGKKTEDNSLTAKWTNNSSGKQTKRIGLMQQVDEWQESSTFTAALEKIESWIFSRIVESVWWQALTPHMQSPVEDLYSSKCSGKVLGLALGDGNFSVNLWKRAFHDAYTRLCPVRSGGHECGCLPVLARMVMEQCISRLDVAMFNAILRESANEMPTDPVSDPIVDSKVLPIPARHLSFGSGAQLKNSIGNWSRCLSDMFGLDEDSVKDDQYANRDHEASRGGAGSKPFRLLNELSDLLMLPKDMLTERAIRKEVCPSIGLTLVIRVLCNFTPDEFCPDPVPGIVLEEVSAEILSEHPQSEEDVIDSFPRSAAPVVYSPPSPADAAEKVADAGGKESLDRRASIIQKKGYTSDGDLDDLDSLLSSIIGKTPMEERTPKGSTNSNAVRYKLLGEVWTQ